MKGLSTNFFASALFALFLLPSQLYSQAKFVKGYVVLANGDSLNGLIEQRNWRKVPQQISFKPTYNAPVTIYKPIDLHSFRIKKGDWYFTYSGYIDPSSLQSNDLDFSHVPDTLHDTLFIRAVVLGRASLYYARDEHDRLHLFLQERGSPVKELNFKRYYIDETIVKDYQRNISRRDIYENRLYKGQLITAFSDCPEVTSRIFSRPLPYAKNQVEEVFLRYNACKNEPSHYAEPKEVLKFKFSVYGGVNLTNLLLESKTVPYWNTVQLNNKPGYSVGIGLRAILPRSSNHWSLLGELHYKTFHAEGYSGNEQQDKVKFDLAYLKLFTMGQYRFRIGQTEPFFNLGISNGWALKYENEVIRGSDEPVPLFPYYRQYEQGFILGPGTSYRNVSLTVMFEKSNAMSSYVAVKSAFKTFYFLLGYTF